jgi:hypothetical protein
MSSRSRWLSGSSANVSSDSFSQIDLYRCHSRSAAPAGDAATRTRRVSSGARAAVSWRRAYPRQNRSARRATKSTGSWPGLLQRPRRPPQGTRFLRAGTRVSAPAFRHRHLLVEAAIRIPGRLEQPEKRVHAVHSQIHECVGAPVPEVRHRSPEAGVGGVGAVGDVGQEGRVPSCSWSTPRTSRSGAAGRAGRGPSTPARRPDAPRCSRPTRCR